MTTVPAPTTQPHLASNLKQVSLQPEQLVQFCEKHPIQRLSLFGSILREDFTDSSDVDILVEFLPQARIGFFELVRLENALTDLIGRKVDLRTPQELSPYFRQDVLNEAVIQYVKN
ncbi:MAG: nucleotidyltransferase family protein [Leptolyngbya sp.]|nr:nucleotidyltransferase family protein [Leptolyngbya sp.]